MPKTRIDDENVQHTGELVVLASKFKVVDDTDHSKVAKFVCSSITAGQVSEITIPDSDDTAVYLTATQTLTNKTLDDTTTVFADTAGPTKKARLELSGVTAGQTRVLTVPDYNGTLTTLAGIEALTGKTLTDPTINGAGGTLVLPTAAAPAQTAEGSVFWDSNDDLLTVGDGTGRKTMCDTSSIQTIQGKVLSACQPEASPTDTGMGTVGAPAAGTLTMAVERLGPFFKVTFTLTGARIPVTDDGANGSFGTLKLLDVAEGGIIYLGSRQDYTAYLPDGTGVPDDAVFEIGVGTDDIAAAADGILAADEDDIGVDIDQTLVAGTTTGTVHSAPNKVVDGTGTAADIYLNWSGTAASIDGNGTIDVTGTISVAGMLLGDD